MIQRAVYLVKTKDGWLGKRRYDYQAGSTHASPTAQFKYARVFSRRQDAEKSCLYGDEVVIGTLKVEHMDEDSHRRILP